MTVRAHVTNDAELLLTFLHSSANPKDRMTYERVRAVLIGAMMDVILAMRDEPWTVTVNVQNMSIKLESQECAICQLDARRAVLLKVAERLVTT